MKKFLLAVVATCLSGGAWAQLPDIPMEKGKFDNNWESLKQWECPAWFEDAKFGLWAHWGPQCEANSGDWFARSMYGGSTYWDEERQQNFNPKERGFKEYCRDWKADKWDPEAIMAKYEKVGAKYFMALANHHDNFDCWDSPYQEWNSVNIGPKKDLGKGWEEAARRHGMKFGMSVHASHAWSWYEIGRKYGDVRLTKADGKGQWWDGYDPNELYAQAHDKVSEGWDDIGRIHSEWNWTNGASIPDEAYKTKLMNRCRQMVNYLNPDMVYFDDTVLPFWGCDDQWGQDFLAYYYNHRSNQNNGGDADVVVMGKVLPEDIKEAMLWDVERGIPDRPQKLHWQTCTCIGGWHYAYHDRGHYKSAETVVRMLIDIVSKNGNLLLSIPLKGEGTYDEQEEAVLNGIQKWMEINGESIYGTRVWWDCFGEGPLAEASNGLNGQGFNEGQNYTSADVRYVTKGQDIYATIMAWPEAGKYTMKAFSPIASSYHGQVESVTLLGYGEVSFEQNVRGLVIDIPNVKAQLSEIAPAFRITFKEGDKLEDAALLKMLIDELDELGKEAQEDCSYVNSGKYNTLKVEQLLKAVKAAKKANDKDAAAVRAAKDALIAAYQDFEANGRNKSGLWSGKYQADQTTEVLVEGADFQRAEGGNSRFGKPANWVVENFQIPNGGDGVKQGLDKYSGKEALMLGVWDDRASNQSGDLGNARIYRRVKLSKGLYYFGAGFNANYGLSNDAYMFVSKELCDTRDIPAQSLAYFNINKVSTDGKVYGLWVNIPKDMEVYIGFQVDLNVGSPQQEFRAEKVLFYNLPKADKASLNKLITDVSKKLTSFSSKTKVYNTGFYNPDRLNEIQACVSEIEAALEGMTEDEVEVNYYVLEDAWETYQKNCMNHGGLLEEQGKDITIEFLKESSKFSRQDASLTTRFAAPLYWTVENFQIPNGGDGVKLGLDNYSGQDALMLGVWNDRGSNKGGSAKLANARIYQTVTLEPGCYFFGASYNAIYSLYKAYMYAAASTDKMLMTAQVPTKSMAYLNINDCVANGETYGIYFQVEEKKDIVLCFQANMSSGSETQEFRAQSVTLLRMDTPTQVGEVLMDGPVNVQMGKGVYDLNGRRLNALQKGVNIVNGRKILK